MNSIKNYSVSGAANYYKLCSLVPLCVCLYGNGLLENEKMSPVFLTAARCLRHTAVTQYAVTHAVRRVTISKQFVLFL